MKKTRGFLLAVAVAAMAFTLSCFPAEDDGGGDGSSNLSDLPKEVYFFAYDNDDNLTKQGKYNGNGDVSFLFSDIRSQSCSGNKCECTNYNGDVFECEDDYGYDTVPAGKIQNGQLSLTWPAVERKYLRKVGNPCDGTEEEYGETCQSTFSVPESLLGYNTSSIYVNNVSGKSYCRLRLYLIKSGEANRATFYYLSESGRVNGNYTSTYEAQTRKYNYDWNYSKGWNILYAYDNSENGNYRTYNSTDNLSKAGGTLEWQLRCD